MGTNPVQTIDAVRQVVGHFVGNGRRQALPVVLGKDPGVEADDPLAAADPVHARGFALEVEQHGNGGKGPTVVGFPHADETIDRFHHPRLPIGIDGFHKTHRIIITWKTPGFLYTGSMRCDFHCHSTASDGELSPRALVAAAEDKGLEALSITDHDTLDAYRRLPAPPRRLTLVEGVEFSTVWGKIGVHILGLNVDSRSDAMAEAERLQSRAREERAQVIAEKLAGYGVEDPLEGARALSGSDQVGRPHFARHMVASGFVANEREAFKKFLGTGKPCDIKQCWSPLARIIAWIREAGGVAVLAHPAKYKLTRTRLTALIDDFQTAGGEGLEVVSGRQLPNVTRDLASLCRNRRLLASWGSDFHGPGRPWADLGSYSTPPADLVPVWSRWD